MAFLVTFSSSELCKESEAPDSSDTNSQNTVQLSKPTIVNTKRVAEDMIFRNSNSDIDMIFTLPKLRSTYHLLFSILSSWL